MLASIHGTACRMESFPQNGVPMPRPSRLSEGGLMKIRLDKDASAPDDLNRLLLTLCDLSVSETSQLERKSASVRAQSCDGWGSRASGAAMTPFSNPSDGSGDNFLLEG